MTSRIIEFAIRNRFLVVFAVLLTAAIGLRAAQELPIDAVPDVTNVQVQVLTQAAALGPVEVEKFVTVPIETVMSGLPRLHEIRSISRFGLSAVTIVFEEGTDIYAARQLVSERLAIARDEIPRGYGKPEMGPISSGLGEIYQFELRGEPMCAPDAEDTPSCYTPMELRTILDWYVAYHLRSVPGIVEVNTFGGQLKTYEVQLNPARLTAFALSLDRVFAALEKNNANAGGAYIERAGEQILIRGEGLVRTLADIRSIVVANRNGTPITIGALGRVATAPMVRQGAVTRDGRGEAVTGIAMMLMGANSRQVVSAVKSKIDAVRRTLPKGVSVDVFYDRTDLVRRTIGTAAINLIEGGVLVVVVLLLMLGNIRGGLVVASAIPLSMLAALIAMRSFGVSGNLMSLGAIDFGLIVDGSVVIVDNIIRTLAEHNPPAGEVRRTTLAAAKEVGRPVAFGVMIIMLVYVPVLSLSGIEGKMFRPMAFAVVAALAASLVLALTWVPAVATWVYRRGVREKETWLVRGVKRFYQPLLRRAVGAPVKVMVGAGVLLTVAMATIPLLGAVFVPKLDEGAVTIQAVRLPSVSLERSLEMTTRVENALLASFPNAIKTVVSKTGRPEIATDPMGVELSDIFVMLKPRSEWSRYGSKEALVAKMQSVLKEQVPGQNYAFSQPIELRTNELISGVRSDVAISVYGDDLATLKRVGGAIAASVRGIRGAKDVKVEQIAGLPVLRVQIDRQRIARYGINAQAVLHAVEAMGGRKVGEIYEGARRFALQVRYVRTARTDLDTIRRIPVAAPSGQLVPIGQLAKLSIEPGPAQISRHRVQRRLSVEVNVRGRDLAGFVAEARARIDGAKVVPAGYFVEWGGQFENLQTATQRLMIAVPIALLLTLGLLYAIYRSLRPALVIFLNVPFAVTGGVLALLARGMPFSISAGVGFIALSGIAVLNGVVLLSYIYKLQEEGMSVAEAAYAGAVTRLRPVLMTAMVAAFGFVPMALATSAGAEVQRPLATVVIGGLLTSTLLTLFVLPAIWTRFGSAQRTA